MITCTDLSLQARYEILRSCLSELQRVSIISPSCCLPPPFPDLRPPFLVSSGTDSQANVSGTESGFGPSQMAGEQLRHVAEACEVPFNMLVYCEINRDYIGIKQFTLCSLKPLIASELCEGFSERLYWNLMHYKGFLAL